MLIFIDLCGKLYDLPVDEQEPAFAFWDTVVSRFVQDKHGYQVWNSFFEFKVNMPHTADFARFKRLYPEWAVDRDPGEFDKENLI